jgi:hypothetical protein
MTTENSLKKATVVGVVGLTVRVEMRWGVVAKTFSAFEVRGVGVKQTVRHSQSVVKMTKKEKDNVGIAPPPSHLHPRDPSLILVGESCFQRICRVVH